MGQFEDFFADAIQASIPERVVIGLVMNNALQIDTPAGFSRYGLDVKLIQGNLTVAALGRVILVSAPGIWKALLKQFADYVCCIVQLIVLTSAELNLDHVRRGRFAAAD